MKGFHGSPVLDRMTEEVRDSLEILLLNGLDSDKQLQIELASQARSFPFLLRCDGVMEGEHVKCQS